MAKHTNQLDQDDGLSAGDEARIKSMLEAVRVPENLNERIKSRLRLSMLVDPCLDIDDRAAELVKPNGSSETAVPQTLEPSSTAPLSTAQSASVAGERTRRGLVMLAMAAALAGLAFLANQWRQPNEHDWLVRQCQAVLGNWEQDNPANLESEASLAELPPGVLEQLTRVTLRGTRSLAALGSKFKGTLYRLDAADGRSLVLMRLSELPAVRGLNSRFSNLHTPSGGWSLVALQLNNETFVLAAECTDQQLMNYIRRPVVT